jgi:hypothetical protein
MANKAYVNEESSTTWLTFSGTHTLSLNGLGADGVRVGDRLDLGASPRASQYSYKLVVAGFGGGTPTVGETCDLYLSFSDGTYADGDVSSSDSSESTDTLPNLMFLGSASVQTTTASDELIVSGTCSIVQRYVSPVVHNNTALACSIGGSLHKFILTPVPPEVQ